MIKNTDELKKKVKENLNKKADEFIDNLNVSNDEEFTIDTIEDIMTRFNNETQSIMIDSVNEAIASFDDKRIVNKKNKKLKDYKDIKKETKK